MMFGTYLRDLRLRAGLSQRALALKSDIGNTYVSHIEHGRAVPGEDTLRKFATALGVDADALIRAAGRIPAARYGEALWLLGKVK